MAGAVKQVARSQPGPAGAPRKPKNERWAEILEVATQLFYERGIEAASLQEIADRLGIMKASLYYYFPSKDVLLFEVLKQAHDEGLAVILSAAETPGDPLVKLEAVIVAHVEHTCQRLVSSAVCQEGIFKISEERRREIFGADHVYQDVFRRLIRDAQKAGLVRPDIDYRLATLSILGSINWVYRWFVPGKNGSAKTIARELADTAIRSIASATVLATRR